MDLCATQLLLNSSPDLNLNQFFLSDPICQPEFHPNVWFVNDLKHFYKTGPGDKLNYLTAYIVLEKFLDAIDREKSSFYFGHAEDLLPVLTLLQIPDFLFQQELLQQTFGSKTSSPTCPKFDPKTNSPKIPKLTNLDPNFDTKKFHYSPNVMPTQNWYNTTYLSPMAGNLIFILNQPDDSAILALNEEVIHTFDSISQLKLFLSSKLLNVQEVEKMCECPQ